MILSIGQSPLLVNSDGVGEEGIILTVLAIDSNGRVAVSKSAIELPTLPPPATSSGSNMDIQLKMRCYNFGLAIIIAAIPVTLSFSNFNIKSD